MNGKTKYLIIAIGIITTLIGVVWSITWGESNAKISELNAEIKVHKTDNVITNSQLQTDISAIKTDISWIKEAMKSNGIQPIIKK